MPVRCQLRDDCKTGIVHVASCDKVRPVSEAFTTGPDTRNETSIEGTVKRVVFFNPETGFSVARISSEDSGEEITVVGSLGALGEGQRIRATGKWKTDPKFGKQFAVVSCLPLEPKTLDGLIKYLSSGLVKGVGKEMATRIVNHFGQDTLAVIDENPQRLTEVPGIGPHRAEKIIQAWNAQSGHRDTLIFLRSMGFSTGLAARVHRYFGQATMDVVKNNPYRLAGEIPGIGFLTADRIAHEAGIGSDDPHRLAAGLMHVIRAACEDEGHVYVPADSLVASAVKLMDVPGDMAHAVLRELIKQKALVLQRKEDVYTPEMLNSEVRAAAGTARLAQSRPGISIGGNIRELIAKAEAGAGLRFGRGQLEAFNVLPGCSVLVITGGPGTGKTTLVKGLLEILNRHGSVTMLAAPTGRAAKRLSETTGRPAGTIHRLLEFRPRTRSFSRNREHPLSADTLIVDEVSMIDLQLFASLVEAVKKGARLVLIGDVDQLPSVGPGSVLEHVIAAADSGLKRMHVIRLNEIYRQAGRSRIVDAAHSVNHGEIPHFDSGTEGSDLYFIRRDEPEQIVSVIMELMGERIPKRFGFDPVRDIQVLTPMNRGPVGTHVLNRQLQSLLNGSGRPLGGEGFKNLRIGDKVMQVRNNYDLEVFNGDIGTIESGSGQGVIVRFDDRAVRYSMEDLSDIVPAYACSVHKSQGSEYPAVVLPVTTHHFVLLRRNLLYTALTRARRLAVLVGSKKALAMAVRNCEGMARYTHLSRRIISQIRQR